MPPARKFRVCFLAFILIISSLSLFVIYPENVKADEDDLFKLFLHPYTTAAMYIYEGNETVEINGTATFDLYYTSTFATRFNYQDQLKVTIYSINPFTGSLREIKNGNSTITLNPEKLGDLVQSCNVELENISFTLSEGDFLIFAVEMIQSGKPIGDIIGKRFEKKLKSRMQQVGEFLNGSSKEQWKEIGFAILSILELTDEFGISGDEIASLANSFSSSSFVYNSEEYPSSVTLPADSSENLTFYFHYAPDDEFSESDGLVDMIKEIPNGTATTWPTRLVNIDPSEPDLNSEEWMLWFMFWVDYIMQPSDDEEDENIITYYLDSELNLKTEEPEGYSPSRTSLNEPKKWEGASLERNKIIKNVTAELYLHYPRLFTLRKINVNVTLYAGEDFIASDQKTLDRTTLIELLQRGPNNPTLFTFEEVLVEEIWNGRNISLKVSVDEAPLFSLRPTYLLCDSNDYPSAITFNFEETTNIDLTIIEGAEDDPVPVIPGGSAEFVLNITSVHEDTIKIDITPDDPEDLEDWSIEHPEYVDISENSFAIVNVVVKSIDNTSSAEYDDIQLVFTASGLTGIDSEEVAVEVSKDAVEYDITVTTPPGKEIKHGESGNYIFKIKNSNTGIWPDSYEIKASSEQEWANLSYKLEDANHVDIGEEFIVNVIVTVPWYTDITTDVLKFTVISKESNEEFIFTVNVTTTVITPNILESTYHFFESVAKDIGLDEILGSYAAAFLIFIIVFLILIFLIPAIYLIKKKFVEIICLDRIKDITPDEEAKFDITLQNPSKQTLTYEIHTELESESWDISLDKESVVVEPKQSSVVVLSVKPTDYIKSDEWVEIKVIVKVVEKKKSVEISTFTNIKGGKPEVKITGVFHWPKIFNKDDRVETSFRLNNTGNVSASNINVILYVNDEEKNKVEDITIPRGGYAEIEMPWIAVKGKNKISIVVK